MAKLNPIVLAAIGVGGAYLLTRQGSADGDGAPPAPPSSQGLYTLKTIGVDSSGYQIGQKSQVILPARYGYVQPAFPAYSRPAMGWDNKLVVGARAMFVSSHRGSFRLGAGKLDQVSRKFVTTTRNKRSYILNVSSGSYAIPSRASLRQYYGLRVGYANFDENLSRLFRWDVIPVESQVAMYADVISSGQQFLVPDTELSAGQFEVRSTTGQVSASFQSRNGSTFVEREGFYHNGEAFIRTDGPAGSLNWGDISDANPFIIYFVSESGMVAINKRTRQTVPKSELRPRWKNLEYGAVPHARCPWTNSVFQAPSSNITGGSSATGRSFWWAWGQDLNTEYFGNKTTLQRNWRNAPRFVSYPAPSAFVGYGVRLYKDKASGIANFGCRNKQCWLSSIVGGASSGQVGTSGRQGSGRILDRRNTSGIFMDDGAPFDFHAPAVLAAFLNTKIGFYREDISIIGET